MPHSVIFSDIDGTLLDLETYSYAASADAVARLVQAGVPVVLCSSKTRAEQEPLRAALGIADPFIVENGSAILAPPGYFQVDLDGAALPPDRPGAWELGVAAARIRRALAEICRDTGLPLVGYADLSEMEVAAITGLELDAARRARQRDYSETLVNPLSPAELATLRTALAARGLAVAHGGRFYTVSGAASDKGVAVQRSAELLRRKLGEIVTIGVGDSANDLPLLAAVDRPYLVRRPAGDWCDVGNLAATRLDGVGPLGWRELAEEVLAL
jgi:mannosyl-3-phosphoglycerate phosphatase family protein